MGFFNKIKSNFVKEAIANASKNTPEWDEIISDINYSKKEIRKESVEPVLLMVSLVKEKSGDNWTREKEREFQDWIKKMVRKKYFRKSGEAIIISSNGRKYFPKDNLYSHPE